MHGPLMKENERRAHWGGRLALRSGRFASMLQVRRNPARGPNRPPRPPTAPSSPPPASNMDRQPPHTEAMEEDPLDSVMVLSTRTV